jgi:hypothetical protein
MISDKSLRSLKEHDENDLWEYASNLFSMQSVLLRMEKAEKDPEVLKDLASRAIHLVDELDAILAVLEDSLDT